MRACASSTSSTRPLVLVCSSARLSLLSSRHYPSPSPSLSGSRRWATDSSSSQPSAAPERETKTLLIVYHSLTGGAKQMAEAAYKAAQAAAAEDLPDSDVC